MICLPIPLLELFRSEIAGSIYTPQDNDYETIRAVWNAQVVHSPSIIVRCRDEKDVVTSVRFANEHLIAMSVRGGGHSLYRFGLMEKGLSINLSAMNGVTSIL